MSLLPDVVPRISHSHALIRKKAVVCLYRLALVYPEALKLAWPKLKDRLMDDDEDTSVTTAVLNVICELGWRRPHDFLPLAPRFFELLVDGGNNWMAIKIIKLFATLTSLEPRLVRKLIRPLINIIETTSAMSLLYECINGIIQGGILDGEGNLEEKDEIANLCVGKLRGMVVTDFDPNLKYVALLAFSRIVVSYPFLVSTHQDVILNCLDDADISIRLQALELAARMVTRDSLQSVVNRLVTQLEDSRHTAPQGSISDVEDMEWSDSVERKDSRKEKSRFSIPNDYRVEVLHRILDICSSDNYSRLADFDWYVDVLMQLVNLLPASVEGSSLQHVAYQGIENESRDNIACRIGLELRNVAVRVKDVRMEATRAAESLILIDNRQSFFSSVSHADGGILGPLAWVIGEFAEYLASPGQTLQSLIDVSNVSLSAKTLSLFIQAAPKVLVHIVHTDGEGWSVARKSEISLFLARIIEFLELLAAHPDLEVQERSIEFLEIMRLAADVMQTGSEDTQVPYLFSSVIPGLFHGLELNPVAPNAQKKVPLPSQLRLDLPLNGNLRGLFELYDEEVSEVQPQVPFNDFYYVREVPVFNKQQGDFSPVGIPSSFSYQNSDMPAEAAAALLRQKVERRQRNRDDPFYIGSDESPGTVGRVEKTPSSMGGDELDLDAIPIVDLKISRMEGHHVALSAPYDSQDKISTQTKKYDVISDEMLGVDEPARHRAFDEPAKARRSLLQVDSSGLRDFSLEEERGSARVDNSSAKAVEDDAEMITAMKEVEKIRLKMQRASERVHLEGIPSEGTLVKKKRKTKKSTHTKSRGTKALESSHDQLVTNNEAGELGQDQSSLQRQPKKA
ncbi:hypothetical protein ARAM_006398 [Aspergillus rambellii]|uniref:AP-3 complex subunit delta n=1 Tax=Aspergillus rambellii TaxID=308745 RepID=A0A0F8X6H9_9EURO|nr:hypothetical protein ARAM_006398 [Aspergillus rambellii]